MASTYVNDLRLNELGTGDASGTWGTITNLNLELIGEGLSYGTQDCFTSNADATTTVADGASDPARAMYFKVTSSATLTATRTLTIAPNTVSRMQFIENATTGGQSINISQGSGANVTIPNGATKAVYLDGAGSGAAVADAFADLNVGTIDATTLQIGGTSITATAAELNYNDITTLGAVTASKTVTADSSGFINFADNQRLRFGAGADLQIYHNASNSYISDAGTGNLFIQASNNLILESATGENYLAGVADGSVTLYYDNAAKLATKSDGVDITGELQSDSLDVDGNADISGTLTMGGNIDLQDNDRIILGNGSDLQIYHDSSASYIAENGTGSLFIQGSNLTLENSGGTNYVVCTSGGAVNLYYNGTSKLETKTDGVNISGELEATSLDINGAANISSTLTMGSHIFLQDNDYVQLGSSQDLQIYHDGSNSYIDDTGTGDLRLRASNDLLLEKYTGEVMLNCNVDAGVDLYYDNVIKLSTTSGGININGAINAVDDITIAGSVYHEGDTNSYFGFHATDQWRVVTGGTEMLEVNDSYILLGANTRGNVQTANVNGGSTPNFYTYNSFVWTLTGNTTLSNPSTETGGMSGVFIFIQDGTGSRTLSLGTDYETAGGAGITLSTAPNAVDIVPYFVQSSGNILLGTPQLAFS